jgi:hypothetical protein
VKHPLNGKRAADWDRKQSITVIAVLPLNGIFPPLSQDEQPVRPLQQVTLRADKISEEGYLRLGHTPLDEANCWIDPADILIIEVLGAASWTESSLTVDEDALERTAIRSAA